MRTYVHEYFDFFHFFVPLLFSVIDFNVHIIIVITQHNHNRISV